MTGAKGAEKEGVNFRAEFFRTYADLRKLPASLTSEVAFVGRSNAGKSSLLNALVNKKDLARTSQTPGKTQLLNYFSVGWQGLWEGQPIEELCFFVDLPGYGYAKVPRAQRRDFQRFIEGYVSNRRQLKAIVLVCDCRREPEEEEQEIIRMRRDIDILLVLTKVDKLSANERRASEKRWAALRPRPRKTYFCSSKEKGSFDLARLRVDLSVVASGTPAKDS